ncbi:hypothetical protein skT53_06310 [Effusibacillus dendaii]|uniref:Uncharacterized protein n=2 Tax=Effusibacillus dendaii TaxID=2743772 RepID=A0A7I8D9Z2_9BACL|nr:hypothetical protein skT53_06310 [Effusibacillus dendaii]
MIYTIISIISFSAFLNLIHITKLFTEDVLLSAIFGGIVTGVGGAIILRAGGSNGGIGCRQNCRQV